MRRFFLLAALTLLGACTSLQVDGQATNEQILLATKEWQDAYDSRDPKRIVRMYDEDAILWGTTAKTIAPNSAAIWEYFKDAASRPNARVVIGEQHVRIFGETAFVSGYYTFTDQKDGQTVSRPARFTLVFHNKAGKWLVVAHHSSVVP